jgi:hypothetical protein
VARFRRGRAEYRACRKLDKVIAASDTAGAENWIDYLQTLVKLLSARNIKQID